MKNKNITQMKKYLVRNYFIIKSAARRNSNFLRSSHEPSSSAPLD